MTDTGSQAAPDIYDPAYVRDVFDRCSDRYIAFSTVCSMGYTGKHLKLEPDVCELRMQIVSHGLPGTSGACKLIRTLPLSR